MLPHESACDVPGPADGAESPRRGVFTASPADGGRGRADLGAVLVLVSLWLLVWWPAVAGRATFYLRDLFFFFEPLMMAVGRQIRAGIFPAWNPASGCGLPLAADPNAGVFYPDSLLVAALGAGAARLLVSAARRYPRTPRAAG